MEDKEIIELYFSRSENAIRETEKKYGHFCHSIAYNILKNHPDSEECVNDTYWQTWNAIPPKHPDRLAAFLGKITRNLALKRYERNAAKKRGRGQIVCALEELAECIPDYDTVEKQVDESMLIDCLNSFLAQLPAENRKIFLQRYWAVHSVKEIAAAHHMTESKVKMMLMRMRGKLRSFLAEEGIVV